MCIDDVRVVGSGDGAVLKSIDYYQSGKGGKSMHEQTLIKVLGYLRHILPPAVMIAFQVRHSLVHHSFISIYN